MQNFVVNQQSNFMRAVSIMEDLARAALRAGLFKDLRDAIAVNDAISTIKSVTNGTNETRQGINNSGKSNTAVGPDNRPVQAKKEKARSRKLPAGSATDKTGGAVRSHGNGHDSGELMQNDLPFVQ